MLQALLGTLFTWGLTAAGAALVFVFSSGQVSCFASVLRFGGGVAGTFSKLENHNLGRVADSFFHATGHTSRL